MSKHKRIYLDYAATTPLDPEVERAMRPYFSAKFGNAGSVHSFGQEAIAAVDEAREKIAKAIGAEFREIIFTASATEANNLALRGVIKSYQYKSAKISVNQQPRLIISAIEHESVLETAKDLSLFGRSPACEENAEVVYVPVNREGIVDLEKLKSALNERTLLVSVMYVNNEIGVIQPIPEIAEIIKNFKKEIFFHTDAVQAFQYLNCDVNYLGVDLMTFSSHKIYGPKGIGALYVRDLRNEDVKFTNPKSYILNPIITGGGQEFGLRSGTENVPGIVGFGAAVELVTRDKEQVAKKTARLREYFWKGLKKIEPKAEINGGGAPHILNVYFPSLLSQDFLVRLDLAGIAASSGAACSARSLEPSYVIKALGYSDDRAQRSIRFSFGKYTSKAELDYALRAINKMIIKK